MFDYAECIQNKNMKDINFEGIEEILPDSEPHGSFDLSDDADALASAGMGTDEDYGGGDDHL